MNKTNKEEFIKRAIEKYGNKYDYSKIEYNGYNTEIKIICRIHGEFCQTPKYHLNFCGCKKCGIELRSSKKRTTLNDFILKATKIHDGKYDYSKVEYFNNKTKVCIICPEHGEFWQTPDAHINQKQGCRLCQDELCSIRHLLSKEEFIDNANKKHNNKYDYSNIKYSGIRSKMCIICPEHGEFYQTGNNHLQGHGCPECVGLKVPTKNEFILKAKNIHGDKYDYSKVNYINNRTNICIICPTHGEFWQMPDAHINQKQGCPICKESKQEKEIRISLIENNISFIYQYKSDWLKRQSLDFYLPDYNIAIECQGIQHFKPIDFFGGKNGYRNCISRDNKKRNLCKENNVSLLYFTCVDEIYYKTKKYEIFKDSKKLISEIIKNKKNE